MLNRKILDSAGVLLAVVSTALAVCAVGTLTMPSERASVEKLEAGEIKTAVDDKLEIKTYTGKPAKATEILGKSAQTAQKAENVKNEKPRRKKLRKARNKETVVAEYLLPETSGFKSYMSFEAITDKSSSQYALQSLAHTGKHGIRQVGERYCVAVGTAFGAGIGTYIDITLENGETIEAVVGDIKDDGDTDSSNMVTAENGCASEFIVDMDVLDRKAMISGDISSCSERWNSPVSAIVVYDNNVFDEDGH